MIIKKSNEKDNEKSNEKDFFKLINSHSLESIDFNSNNNPLILNIFEQFSGIMINKNDFIKYIQAIISHREFLKEKLGREIGYGVTILDYFSNIEKKINNPKVLEMDTFLELLKSSKEDQKTGLLNCKFFKELLINEINRAKRNVYPVSVLFIDLDGFKEFNDIYGHIHGDQYLQYIANNIKNIVRQEDIAARFGGDEFIILLPYTDKFSANIVANRLISEIRKSPFTMDNPEKEKYVSSLSIGYATFPFDTEEAEDLIQKADIALYEAKKNGKNQILGYGHHSKKVFMKNKREKLRYNCKERKIIINLQNSNNIYPAFIKNISESGALISIPNFAPLFKGIDLKCEIDIRSGNNLNKIQFTGKIIYTKKNKTGLIAAVKFEKKIDDVELIVDYE